MRSSLFVSAAVFVIGVALSANAKNRPTIYDGMLVGDGQGELSTFVELMNQVFRQEDLQRIFDGDAKFTVFAPSNTAFEELFAALSDQELEELQDLNNGRLERLLRYHLAQGEWRKGTGALRMLDDNVAQTYSEGGELKVDEATVEDQTRYQNGLVATINTVISPPNAPLPGETSLTTSSHSNDLFFETSDSVSGTFGAHSVTPGQPYGPVLWQFNNKLIINAGRKNSETPVALFLSDLDALNPEQNVLAVGTCGGATLPSQLHFTQVVDSMNMDVDGKNFSCPDVRFAQGECNDNNNWWVSQPLSTTDAVGGYLILNCTESSNASCKLRFDATGDSDQFDVSAVCD